MFPLFKCWLFRSLLYLEFGCHQSCKFSGVFETKFWDLGDHFVTQIKARPGRCLNQCKLGDLSRPTAPKIKLSVYVLCFWSSFKVTISLHCFDGLNTNSISAWQVRINRLRRDGWHGHMVSFRFRFWESRSRWWWRGTFIPDSHHRFGNKLFFCSSMLSLRSLLF